MTCRHGSPVDKCRICLLEKQVESLQVKFDLQVEGHKFTASLYSESLYETNRLNALVESQKEEIEILRNYLETLRSNTPYGMYQQQITEVLQDAEEWPCTCGNCDGEHFGMAINRRTENEQT